MIVGDRVRHARELKGWTQADLAERVGTTQGSIAKFENGLVQPAPETIEAIALRTGFPLAFFRKPAAVDFPEGSILFRARQKISPRDVASMRRYGSSLAEMVETLGSRLTAIPLRLPRLNESPEVAAQMARASLALAPDTPVSNMIRTLERAGVWVFPYPVRLDGIDAFSAWISLGELRPVVVVSHALVGDRMRFTVAHELGHLVLHQAAEGDRKSIEQEAHHFASEFLMPASAMHAEMEVPVTLSSLAPLKPRWGVSLQALVYRARALGIVSDRQHKYLMHQIGTRGWRTEEPSSGSVRTERPRLLLRMVELLYGKDPDPARIASDVAESRNVVRLALEAHARYGQTTGIAEAQAGEASDADAGKLLAFSRW